MDNKTRSYAVENIFERAQNERLRRTLLCGPPPSLLGGSINPSGSPLSFAGWGMNEDVSQKELNCVTPSHMKKVLVEARSNIALLKYWGKSSAHDNLPAAPSLSITLDCLVTQTQISPLSSQHEDIFYLNDHLMTGHAVTRVSQHLDRVLAYCTPRQKQGVRPCFEVRSWNQFTTSAGLASSASGFAALTTAILTFAKQNLSLQKASVLARQGSGSAARSMYGGLVLLGAGTPGQPDSSFASQLLSENDWPELRMVIGLLDDASPKSISSTQAMIQTAKTSPYYAQFISEGFRSVETALCAIVARDIEQLGSLTEKSALHMHAAMLAAEPAIIYWQSATVASLQLTHELRRQGVPVWFTCDAGAHPKLFTLDSHAHQVATALQSITGIKQTLIAKPGKGPEILHVEE